MNPSGNVASVERRIAASPATVFSFFSSSDRWLLWQGVEATIELKPGGLFRMNVSGDGLATGRFLEIVPEQRLKFTWGWEMPERRIPPGSSLVEIDLRPEGSGTLLRLTHTGLPPDWVELHRQGGSYTWASCRPSRRQHDCCPPCSWPGNHWDGRLSNGMRCLNHHSTAPAARGATNRPFTRRSIKWSACLTAGSRLRPSTSSAQPL
ncbi:MAG: hypothetical protein DLM70_08470 [Chloroflexi bacterium]|nr:MAG: hypothetical protein DLM70_08470 [Chloroflexota bacterium]